METAEMTIQSWMSTAPSNIINIKVFGSSKLDARISEQVKNTPGFKK